LHSMDFPLFWVCMVAKAETILEPKINLMEDS
jgi:hypothetical protein